MHMVLFQLFVLLESRYIVGFFPLKVWTSLEIGTWRFILWAYRWFIMTSYQNQCSEWGREPQFRCLRNIWLCCLLLLLSSYWISKAFGEMRAPNFFFLPKCHKYPFLTLYHHPHLSEERTSQLSLLNRGIEEPESRKLAQAGSGVLHSSTGRPQAMRGRQDPTGLFCPWGWAESLVQFSLLTLQSV